jgi:hypothetical protein
MATGKDAEGNPRDYVFTYEVLSFEDVTVLAGTFRAFKIGATQASTVRLGDTFVIYRWYSQDVKREVKSQPGPISGIWKSTAQGYELKSFKLVEKQLTTPEIKSSIEKVEPATKPEVSPPEKPRISIPVSPPQGPSIVTVTGTFANIRSGAGSEFSTVGTVKQGDKLILLGEYGEWFNVRLESGQEGWINNKFVE